MDGEHAHVEGEGDDDEAEDAREEVLEPDARGHVARIAQQDPELEGGERAHPCDGEEADPLHTYCCAERDS